MLCHLLEIMARRWGFFIFFSTPSALLVCRAPPPWHSHRPKKITLTVISSPLTHPFPPSSSLSTLTHLLSFFLKCCCCCGTNNFYLLIPLSCKVSLSWTSFSPF